MSEFTLQEYRKIIKHHKHRVCDFYDSLKKDQWTILRHDVEFVPNRAFELNDLYANSLGVLLAYLILKLFKKTKN